MYNPQLDTFIKVAEAGSFSKAAQALFITPTAVIKQMNLLENRLGVTLFHRSHQGLSLSRAGESLLADARHIVRYSQDAVARARVADRAEKHVIRVGMSLLTPTAPLSDLWPRIRERCPGMSMQIVTFENTPEAPRTLGSLGQDIDVILGVFDDLMLRERGCAGLEISREPLCCAVPAGSDLAEHERVTLDDLRGETFMLIRSGWTEATDHLRDRIRADYPDIAIEDFDQYRADAFNHCANEGCAMATIGFWDYVQPSLITLPTDWGLSLSYGVLHAPEPSEHVAEFLDVLRAVLAE